MSSEHVSLSTLRGISARAAAILDRYSHEQAIWVPVAAFKQFIHTLHWSNFADLDLRLLDDLEPGDRNALIDELRVYNDYLHRQRERVSRFHRAYHQWIEKRDRDEWRTQAQALRLALPKPEAKPASMSLWRWLRSTG